MSNFLILTADQNAGLAGETSPGHKLEPVALADGVTFVLPVAVLTDPAHAIRHDALADLPQRTVAAGEWIQPEDD